jgi:hypothetical protein
MFTFWRKLLVVLLMCGLPLQGLHAAAMTQCAQNEPAGAAAYPQHAEHAQHAAHPQDSGHEAAHESGIAHHHDDGDVGAAADGKFACDGCNFCQACSAPAMPSVAIVLSMQSAETPQPAPPCHIVLFEPEQPQRPPLQS